MDKIISGADVTLAGDVVVEEDGTGSGVLVVKREGLRGMKRLRMT